MDVFERKKHTPKKTPAILGSGFLHLDCTWNSWWYKVQFPDPINHPSGVYPTGAIMWPGRTCATKTRNDQRFLSRSSTHDLEFTCCDLSGASMNLRLKLLGMISCLKKLITCTRLPTYIEWNSILSEVFEKNSITRNDIADTQCMDMYGIFTCICHKITQMYKVNGS